MNGALVAAVFQAAKSPQGRIRLVNRDSDGDHSTLEAEPSAQAVDNPLANVDIPRNHLVAMFVVSIVGSIISAFVFTVSLDFLAE